MNLNMILAVVWFVVGVAWLTATWTKGDVLPVIRLGDVSFSPAWLALALCAYNLVRWRMAPRRRAQDPVEASLDARRQRRRSRENQDQPPDPTFNFTDAPPDPRRTEPPPPTN